MLQEFSFELLYFFFARENLATIASNLYYWYPFILIAYRLIPDDDINQFIIS